MWNQDELVCDIFASFVTTCQGMQRICDVRREFTLNMISEWFLEAANHTCGAYDRGVNELDLAGLTAMPSIKVRASCCPCSTRVGWW